MRITRIKLWDKDFSQWSDSLWELWVQLQKIKHKLSQENTKDGVIASRAIAIIDKEWFDSDLWVWEQLILACLEIKSEVELITKGERLIPSNEDLSKIDPNHMLDLITKSKSATDLLSKIHTTLTEINTYDSSVSIETHLKLLAEMDYSQINFNVLDNVNTTLLETQYHDAIINFLETKWISVIFINVWCSFLRSKENLCYIPWENNLQRLVPIAHIWGDANIQYFHGVYLKQKNILIELQWNQGNLQYIGELENFNGIYFSVVWDENAHVHVLDFTNEIYYKLEAVSYYETAWDSYKFFLDAWETSYIEYFGDRFWELKEILPDEINHPDEEDEISIEIQKH